MSGEGQRAARALRSIVIVGGGTAAWMAAAALAKVMASASCALTLIEPRADGTAGAAEGSIPNLRAFHRLLDIDERELLRATRASFKLATRFHDWRARGDSFLHPFGSYGLDVRHEVFQAYWLARKQAGSASRLEEWSVTGLAAALGRFGARPASDSSPLRHLSYAYHFDAALYARFLRIYAEKRGVHRIEGEVTDVTLDPMGRIESLRLSEGRSVSGDFFIDCSGAEARLIGQALEIGYEDWSHWLPCDRLVAIDCESAEDPAPITESRARESGWQWRIPLQGRTGHGHVYCSAYLSDDEAATAVPGGAPGTLRCEPRLQRFKAGRRASPWVRNCLALGEAAGFLEPLEWTGSHLVQTGLGRLFALFPDRDFEPAIGAEYNRLAALEYERLRDFLILHYAASQRDDAPLWRHCRAMPLPPTLAHKRDLFARTGRIVTLEEETFSPASWLAIYVGLGVWEGRHEPVIDLLGSPAMASRLEAMPATIRKAVETLPAHATYLKEVATLA
ncbi:MAG TPA: tryptophan halogenase family protein [Steroidobacteraceae bacterium]|nr:tryptophan halogenase family protein [Steroidobacteraceae bacterium]